MGCVDGLDADAQRLIEEAEYERRRDARIEEIRDWGARELAEKVFDLEEEIGEERDGLCTGMHADIAETQAAWEDMRDEAAELRTQLKVAEAKLAGAAPYVAGVNARMRMLEGAIRAYEGYVDERDRYRLAWLSARRRASSTKPAP